MLPPPSLPRPGIAAVNLTSNYPQGTHHRGLNPTVGVFQGPDQGLCRSGIHQLPECDRRSPPGGRILIFQTLGEAG